MPNLFLPQQVRKLTIQSNKMAAQQLASIRTPVPLNKLSMTKAITVEERERLEEAQWLRTKKPMMVNRKSQYRLGAKSSIIASEKCVFGLLSGQVTALFIFVAFVVALAAAAAVVAAACISQPQIVKRVSTFKDIFGPSC